MILTLGEVSGVWCCASVLRSGADEPALRPSRRTSVRPLRGGCRAVCGATVRRAPSRHEVAPASRVSRLALVAAALLFAVFALPVVGASGHNDRDDPAPDGARRGPGDDRNREIAALENRARYRAATVGGPSLTSVCGARRSWPARRARFRCRFWPARSRWTRHHGTSRSPVQGSASSPSETAPPRVSPTIPEPAFKPTQALRPAPGNPVQGHRSIMPSALPLASIPKLRSRFPAAPSPSIRASLSENPKAHPLEDPVCQRKPLSYSSTWRTRSEANHDRLQGQAFDAPAPRRTVHPT